MRGRRATCTILTALALVAAASCGGAAGGEPSPSAAPTTLTSGPTPSGTVEPVPAPTTPPTPPPEEPGPPPAPEPDGPEPPAAGGGDAMSVELAGLPVGGGASEVVDGAWCQVLFWGGELPDGASVRFDRVVVGDTGGTLVDGGCGGAPPCPGTTMSAEEPGRGCAVLVRPPSSDAQLVLVRLDGVARCPDVASCDTLTGTATGRFFAVTRPFDPEPPAATAPSDG